MQNGNSRFQVNSIKFKALQCFTTFAHFFVKWHVHINFAIMDFSIQNVTSNTYCTYIWQYLLINTRISNNHYDLNGASGVVANWKPCTSTTIAIISLYSKCLRKFRPPPIFREAPSIIPGRSAIESEKSAASKESWICFSSRSRVVWEAAETLFVVVMVSMPIPLKIWEMRKDCCFAPS